MDQAKAFALSLCLVAAAVIAIGRRHVRAARKMESKQPGRRRKKSLGWTLVLFGTLLMMAGIAIF